MKRKKFKINKDHLNTMMQKKRIYSFSEMEKAIGINTGTFSRIGSEKPGLRFECSRQTKDLLEDGLITLSFNKDDVKKVFFEVN